MNNWRNTLPPLSSLLPFEAAARLGSITKAGTELGLTQAAISKQIRALEENLGTALFERRNRAVHLTEDGRELGRILSEAFEAVGSFSEDLRRKKSEEEVVLRSQLCEGLYWLLPRLSGFYQQHPDVAVRVSTSTQPISESSERFDLALQTTGRNSGTAKLAFTAADEVIPVCSPKYLQSLKTPLSISELPHQQLLHHKVEPQDWVDWDTWLERLNIGFRVGQSGAVFDSYPMMMQAVLEGHGIALGWRRTVEQYLSSGTLVRPFAESLVLPDSLSVYKSGRQQMRKGAAILLKWLEHELA